MANSTTAASSRTVKKTEAQAAASAQEAAPAKTTAAPAKEAPPAKTTAAEKKPSPPSAKAGDAPAPAPAAPAATAATAATPATPATAPTASSTSGKASPSRKAKAAEKAGGSGNESKQEGDGEDAPAEADESLECKLGALKDMVAKQLHASQLFAKQVNAALKGLEKKVHATVKASSQGRKKQKGAKRTNFSGGLSGPAKLSDKLCDFLGVPHGTEMSRTQATSQIYEYIKTRDLRQADNKRIICPDDKLRTILVLDELKDGENIEYFNIARFIKHNFSKVDPKVDAPAQAEPAAQ